jgi:hypothetical protein
MQPTKRALVATRPPRVVDVCKGNRKAAFLRDGAKLPGAERTV